VNPTGTGGCFSTLQAALDASGKKDVIEVEAGSYPSAATVPARARVTIRGAGKDSTFFEETLTIGTKAQVTLSDVTIRDTSNDGIFLEDKGRLVLLDSVIRDCPRSGVRFDTGNLTVERSTIRDNDDSGIDGGTRIAVRDSTISGNDFNGVSAVNSITTILIESSTVSGNNRGVNMNSLNRLSIFGSTIADNGRGIFDQGANRTRLANTILADNGVDCEVQEFAESLYFSQGYNLIESNLRCDFKGDLTGNIEGVDPALGPLDDNGGPTRTHALSGGSAAIDAGNPRPLGKGNRCRPEDQRGEPRDGRCDIGAFEF